MSLSYSSVDLVLISLLGIIYSILYNSTFDFINTFIRNTLIPLIKSIIQRS